MITDRYPGGFVIDNRRLMLVVEFRGPNEYKWFSFKFHICLRRPPK